MSQIEPQEDVDYDDVFESILTDAKSRGLSDDQVWEVWQTGSKQEYNDALEWVAEWITGAQMLGHGDDVVGFAKNMAMSIRAAKRPTLPPSTRETETTEKERANRLEAMIDRMSEKIVDAQSELAEYKELYNNTAKQLNSANYLISQIKSLLLTTKA